MRLQVHRTIQERSIDVPLSVVYDEEKFEFYTCANKISIERKEHSK